MPTHDVITIGIPVLSIFFGILLNRQGVNDLKSDLKAEMRAVETRSDAKFTALDARIGSLERDYRDFYKTQSEQEMRIDSLEKK